MWFTRDEAKNNQPAPNILITGASGALGSELALYHASAWVLLQATIHCPSLPAMHHQRRDWPVSPTRCALRDRVLASLKP